MTSVTTNSPRERLVHIQRRITERGAVRIDELAVELGVSEMTIRRDLDELETLGVARRVRGGAVALGPEAFSERHQHNARAKGRIAEKLISMVPTRGTIALDASSTLYRLAGSLDGAQDLVVVTNGLDTFQNLTGKPGISAIITGGGREPRTGSLVGSLAIRSANEFLFDMFFCSAAAFDADMGSSEASLAEADVKRALSATSSHIVLAVDHTKLNNRAQARVFRLDEIDVLVTDLDPDDQRLARYRAAGLEIR